MLPLKNKTVLVTRSKEQAAEFIIHLQELGATPIHFPLIKIEAINQSELERQYNEQHFDWIIFTSANAVHTFFKVVQPISVNAKIAVVGTKTEEALKTYKLASNFIPSQFTAEILAKEIPVIANENILLPQSAISKNNLINLLGERQTTIFPIKTYQNTPIKYIQEKIEEIFIEQIDFVTFTSGSSVKSFAALGIPLKNSKTVCIGPETAKIAQEHNLKVDAIASPHTIEGITEAMIRFIVQ